MICVYCVFLNIDFEVLLYRYFFFYYIIIILKQLIILREVGLTHFGNACSGRIGQL